jgi:hypothetical protein
VIVFFIIRRILNQRLRICNRKCYIALFRFIFPFAQRCFSSRDSFLRAAALMRPRLPRFFGVAIAAAGPRALRAWVELNVNKQQFSSRRAISLEEEV